MDDDDEEESQGQPKPDVTISEVESATLDGVAQEHVQHPPSPTS